MTDESTYDPAQLAQLDQIYRAAVEHTEHMIAAAETLVDRGAINSFVLMCHTLDQWVEDNQVDPFVLTQLTATLALRLAEERRS